MKSLKFTAQFYNSRARTPSRRRLLGLFKKKYKFIPFLGIFSKLNRIRFKLKKRRSKFFKFFRKFFRQRKRFTGNYTAKFNRFAKKRSKISYVLHIFRTLNNVFVNVSTAAGRSLYVYSGGRTMFKGSKRLSPVAAQVIGRAVSSILLNSKIQRIFVVFHSRSILRY